jgi:hypothetical protein
VSLPRVSARSTQQTPSSSLLGLIAREFIAQATEASFAEYNDSPARFVLECFEWQAGEGPTPYQLEVLRQLPQRRRLALRGPHSLGKTALAAWIVVWFALTRESMQADWKAVTTASAWRQLTHYLWPEIHKWTRRLLWQRLGRERFDERTELLQLTLKLAHGEAFAAASDKPDLIEGAHASHLLYVFDEAKAIPPATWDAAEGALASGDCFALAISTPGEPQGRFYEIHQRKPGYEDWWTRHVTLAECVAAGRVSREWAEQRARQWGEGAAVYANRVLGEFASSDEDGVIPLAWVEAANERWRALEDSGQWGEFTCCGVDVARGGEDQTVIALRYGNSIRELRRSSMRDTMATTGAVAGILQAHGGEAVVDVVGIGAGVVDRLKEQGKSVRAFNASEHTEAKDRSGELGFINKRSAAWWRLRELLDPANGHELALPPDDLLTGDLTAPHWRTTSGGKVQVESKDDIRKRLGRSTDDGDAAVMAFWVEPTPSYPPLQIGRVSYSGRNMSGRRREPREVGRLVQGSTTYIFKA